MTSLERLKDKYSNGIQTLGRISRHGLSQAMLEQNHPQGTSNNLVQESLLGPTALNEFHSNCMIDSGSKNSQLEQYRMEEAVQTIQKGSEINPHTTLKSYQEFFNNRPLMRCLDPVEDGDQSKRNSVILPETVARGFTARLDCPTNDAESLFEFLLRETTRDVENSLQDSARRNIQVKTWWDNVRAQLRDEDKEAQFWEGHEAKCSLED